MATQLVQHSQRLWIFWFRICVVRDIAGAAPWWHCWSSTRIDCDSADAAPFDGDIAGVASTLIATLLVQHPLIVTLLEKHPHWFRLCWCSTWPVDHSAGAEAHHKGGVTSTYRIFQNITTPEPGLGIRSFALGSVAQNRSDIERLGAICS